jgi:hypothetical protein
MPATARNSYSHVMTLFPACCPCCLYYQIWVVPCGRRTSVNWCGECSEKDSTL